MYYPQLSTNNLQTDYKYCRDTFYEPLQTNTNKLNTLLATFDLSK